VRIQVFGDIVVDLAPSAIPEECRRRGVPIRRADAA